MYSQHKVYRKKRIRSSFNFVIPASKKQPERILHAINRPGGDTAKAFAFSWVDTREARPANSRAYTVLNDSGHIPPASVVDALRNYDVNPILWSKREEFATELAA
ncbi:MAG: DUF1829 domain-containing protein [Nitrospirae bacterium]|nr:DUF1829 domain-containing protein [Nitrospirota bacterium]